MLVYCWVFYDLIYKYLMYVCVWFIAGYIPLFGMICRPQMVDNQMGLWFLCAFHLKKHPMISP